MTNDKEAVEVLAQSYEAHETGDPEQVYADEQDAANYRRAFAKRTLRDLAQAGFEITPGWSSDMKAAPRDEAAGKIMLCNVKSGAIALCWWVNNLGWCGSEGWNSVKDTWESVPIDFTPTHYRPIFLPPVEEPNQESNDE